MSLSIRRADKPSKYRNYFRWMVSTKKNNVAEIYLGWMRRLGFELNVGNRTFSLYLVFFAVYISPWGFDFGDDEGHSYGIFITLEHLAYVTYGSRSAFFGWPWAPVWMYSRTLLTEAPLVPRVHPRGWIRRRPRPLWNLDHERNVFIRAVRWCYRRVPARFRPAGPFPGWMLSTGRARDGFLSGVVASRWTTVFDYQYRLRSGEVQRRKAIVSIREMGWHPWILSWLPWSWALTRITELDIEFDEEVGEQTGTWKGGVTGTSYIMRRGETVQECFDRFQQERQF